MEDALLMIEREFASLGLIDEVRTHGSDPYSSHCELFDARKNHLTEGLGKGVGLQSRVSAIFEALEHYFTEPDFFERTLEEMDVEFIRIDEMAGLDILQREKPIELLLRHFPDSLIPCRVFKSLDERKFVHYPIFLTAPNYANQVVGDGFDYGLVSKYVTNNGTAIGTSFEEAAIHALCERIERGALSAFLLRTHVADSKAPINLVNSDSLPHDLQALHKFVQEEVGDEVYILNATSDFGVATFCASASSLNMSIQPQGWGSSLRAGYALERPLLEALQMFHLYPFFSEEVELDHARFMRSVGKYPRYLDCVKNDIKSAIVQNGRLSTDFGSIPDFDAVGDLNVYLGTLANQVEKQGFEVFYSQNCKRESGNTCVNILVPGLEHFHIVTSGNLVVPNARGKQILASSGTLNAA